MPQAQRVALVRFLTLMPALALVAGCEAVLSFRDPSAWWRDGGANGAADGRRSGDTLADAPGDTRAADWGDGPHPDRATPFDGPLDGKPPADSRPKADAAKPKADATKPKADAAQPKADAAQPKADAAKPKADAAKPKADAAKPKADAAKPKADAAKPKPDLKPPADLAPKPDVKPKPDLEPPADLKPPADSKPPPPPDQGSGGLYSGTFPANTSTGFRWGNLTVKGVARQVRLYFPSGGLAASPRLVLLFHGTDGHGEDDIWGASATTLADAQKLLIAAPEARTMSAGDWDNHSAGQRFFETYPNVSPSTNNDLQLVQAIIAEAQRAYNANTKRVYAMGFSNGAFFAALTATALPNQIAAFASNAGGLVRCATTDSCTFTGSGTSCATLASQGGWCNCTGAEKPGPIPGTGRKPPAYIVTAANDFVVSPYYSCQLATRMSAQGFTVSTTVRSSGGHSWPNNFATTAWPFLSQYVLP